MLLSSPGPAMQRMRKEGGGPTNRYGGKKNLRETVRRRRLRPSSHQKKQSKTFASGDEGSWWSGKTKRVEGGREGSKNICTDPKPIKNSIQNIERQAQQHPRGDKRNRTESAPQTRNSSAFHKAGFSQDVDDPSWRQSEGDRSTKKKRPKIYQTLTPD